MRKKFESEISLVPKKIQITDGGLNCITDITEFHLKSTIVEL